MDTPETEPPAAPTPEQAADSPEPKPRLPGWWLDVLLAVVLFCAAFGPRWEYGRGDLWLDEADYVVASLFGFDANRRDNELAPGLPEPLVVLRHYHGPLSAYLLGLGRAWGDADQQIRLPFMVAGSLAAVLTYLCGLRMFRRRDVAFFCGFVVAFTPMQVRAGSHALPWAVITLTLLSMTYALQSYAATRNPVWILLLFGALAVQFVNSEMFFPALLAVLLAAPVALWPHLRADDERGRVAFGVGFGLLLFFAVAVVFWPAGLARGNSFRNLMHYADLAAEYQNPARIGGSTYTVAPRWAYLYWYANDFRPYFVLYAAGGMAALLLLALRRLPREAGVMWVLGGFIILVAHRANLFGPEYLAHGLPFLTLGGGLALLPLAAWRGRVGLLLAGVVMAGAGVVYVRFQHEWQNEPLQRQMNRSRWPQAAKFLAPRLQTGDGIAIGPQDPSVPRWYLYRELGWSALETRIAPLPLPTGKVGPKFLANFKGGGYRFAVLSSTFMPPPFFASRLKSSVARSYRRVYASGEGGAGKPRLLIYERAAPKAKP